MRTGRGETWKDRKEMRRRRMAENDVEKEGDMDGRRRDRQVKE